MQEFLIPVEIPVVSNTLTLQVYDEDVTENELAATTELSIKSMIKYDISNDNLGKQKTQCKWINLFGAPVGRSGKNSSEMNRDPATASNWKGRLLVEYWCEDFKYPVYKVQNIAADFDRYMFENCIEMRNFLIIGEFGQAMCLPEQAKYRLKFKLAE